MRARLLAGGVLLAALAACTGPPTPEQQARAILDSAQRYLGPPESLERIRVIDAAAHGTGPGGAFEARIVSARDGDMRMERSSAEGGFVAGIRDGEGWFRNSETGALDAVDPVTRTFLRGHELHMLVLVPVTRLRLPVSAGTSEFSGQAARVVRFLDELDGPIEMYIATADGRPLGMKTINHSGRGERDVFVHFEDWRENGGVRLFWRAIFVQGEDRYVYDYHTLDAAAERVPDPESG